VKVTPFPGFKGGVVPLSEHEQRQLEQIEQALYREDRRLARLVRSSDPRVHYKRRVVQAAIGLAAGAGMIAAGVAVQMIYLAVAGFAVMLLCGVLALSGWRHMAGAAIDGRRRSAGARRPGAKSTKSGGKKKRSGSRRAAFMERLDERWRRRQEGGG
jgi:hypothetical protein